MKRFWDGLAGTLLVLWIGGMWAIGYVAAPVLFASLGDKQLAGLLAGNLFEWMAWIGITAGIYLLIYRIARDGGAALKSLFFWAVVVMLALTLAGLFGIQPIMQSLKDQATRLADVVQVFKLDAATAAASAVTPTTVARAAPAQTSVKVSTPAKPAAAPAAAKPAKPLAAPSTAPRRAEPVATATRGSDEGEWESF